MMTITLDRFLAELPEFVSGIDNVVVATYNNIDSHKEGGEIDVNGRKLSILCGGADYADLKMPRDILPNEDWQWQETKIKAAKTVSDGLAHVAFGSLVILYAGMSCWSEMVKLAYRLARRDVKVVLVNCGCGGDFMSKAFRSENIRLVMPTHNRCNGGKKDLSRIIARLIK